MNGKKNVEKFVCLSRPHSPFLRRNPKIPRLSISRPLVEVAVIDDLSSDQYYGYRICMAVMLGTVYSDLELLEVGGLSHVRWLTLARRILRYYVSVHQPSKELST